MLRVITEDQSSRIVPAYVATGRPVSFAAGFYDREWDGAEPCRWMERQGRLEFEPAPVGRYLSLWVSSEFFDLSQELTVRTGEATHTFALTHGWMQLSVAVPAGCDHGVLEVNKLFPRAYYPADGRTLAVRVRQPRVHGDAEHHAHVVRQHANARLNTEETMAGATELQSTAPVLGIDMYGVCNVKPPCVYCMWDFSKELEGDQVDVPFTVETLGEYGDFFDNALNLVNCSIGEPFMMKNFDELLELFGRQGKTLEVATNGQILTDRNIERLLGHNIDLYVSLDAGTPETYAKLRNDTWERIVVNLRRLIAAKQESGGLPRIHLVFMPMKINLHEMEGFVKLCAELEVDRMVLRPLNYTDSFDLVWDRDGYTFDYQEELLPFDQLVEASARAATLCRQYGVRLSDQMDFGGAADSFVAEFSEGSESESEEAAATDGQPEAAPPTEGGGGNGAEPAAEVAVGAAEALPSLGQEGQPICTEPWKSLYILRRGILPCCYGGQPLATMNAYREAWNAPLLQEIRSELAAGRLHRYCLDSPACPVLRKVEHGHQLPWKQAVFMKTRGWWHTFNRVTADGWRARLAWPVKAAVGFGLDLARAPRATFRRVVHGLKNGGSEPAKPA